MMKVTTLKILCTASVLLSCILPIEGNSGHNSADKGLRLSPKRPPNQYSPCGGCANCRPGFTCQAGECVRVPGVRLTDQVELCRTTNCNAGDKCRLVGPLAFPICICQPNHCRRLGGQCSRGNNVDDSVCIVPTRPTVGPQAHRPTHHRVICKPACKRGFYCFSSHQDGQRGICARHQIPLNHAKPVALKCRESQDCPGETDWCRQGICVDYYDFNPRPSIALDINNYDEFDEPDDYEIVGDIVEQYPYNDDQPLREEFYYDDDIV